jgi:hypothetical protein
MAQLDGLLDCSAEQSDRDKSASGDGDTVKLDRPSSNRAVARCIHAWRYAYNKKRAELDEDESQYPAEKAASIAYLRAMPPLVGRENISDFIACVTYAVVIRAIWPSDAQQYLAAAKIALGAIYHQPKPLAGKPKREGSSPESFATGGK